MRSDVAKKGIPAAPNRSLLYALGYTKEELATGLILRKGKKKFARVAL